jgi:hypothetical protein
MDGAAAGLGKGAIAGAGIGALGSVGAQEVKEYQNRQKLEQVMRELGL